MRRAVALFTFVLLPACENSAAPGPADSTAARIVEDALPPLARSSGRIEQVETGVLSLTEVTALVPVNAENCGLVDGRLWEACQTITEAGLVTWCEAKATFFMAHDVPRCGARVSLWETETAEFPEIVAFDLSGEPVVGYQEGCGNGVLDEAEVCDDGNHLEWDGCDPNCQQEQFQGCEVVIEHYFALAETARVPAAGWRGPRTHVMVHDGTSPLRAVDASLCAAAGAAASDVCYELIATMPFVGSCDASTRLDPAGDSCAVRLEVGFSRVSPEDAVFTTALPGVLEFTLR